MHAVPGPAQPRVVALAYDAIAAEYDAEVAGDAWMRRVLHAHYTRVFRPGQRILDVGCGTGLDALFLASRGIDVVGVDVSAEMIARLHVKAAPASRVDARVLAIEELGTLADAPFDGLISAFAGLSTLPNLIQFATDAQRLLKPGGRLILHMLNRFSLWEWLGYVTHGQFHTAAQVGRMRNREFTIGGRAVRHTLYFPREAYAQFLLRNFRLRTAFALGTVRPPHTVHRIPPRAVRALEWLDVRTGAWPLLQNAGRFFVLDLERLPG